MVNGIGERCEIGRIGARMGTMNDVALRSEEVDGRHLRRERNREAVVEALLEFYREGNLQPSATEVAERAGSSARSLFRYFDDVDDLCSEAIRRQNQRIMPLAMFDIDLSESFSERLDTLINARMAMFEANGFLGHVARMRAPIQPLIAAELAQGRTFMRNQVKKILAPELGALDPVRAEGALATVDVLCSWEGYQLLRVDQGHNRVTASAILRTSIATLLGITLAD